MVAEITVDRTDPIGRISPNVYGHFAEHLGRCIYGGVWVGDDAPVETTGGIRDDTVELLRALDVPVLRWPGGCFADDYHWADGVGPRSERPRRRNLWWAQGRSEVFEESNEFGTDEFVRLCERIDAEPYLAANVGSGTPDEAANWAEYCNYDGDTALARRRAENGSSDPHGVTYWGVGNENWGCGGRYNPREYAAAYRQFANYLHAFDRTMSEAPMELIACGHFAGDWNAEFLDALADEPGATEELIDHISVHRYIGAGDDVDFTDEEYYRLFADARKVGRDVDDAAAVLADSPVCQSVGDDVGIIVDEWGVWHPQATGDNGLDQANTVRDALSAAGILDQLNQRADVVTMANLAQTVNVLQCLVETDETAAWPTPTYRVFEAYRGHMGGTALPTTVECGEVGVPDEPFDAALVSASTSERGDDGTLFCTVSNRHIDDPETVHVEVGDDADVASVQDATVAFADADVADHSTPETAGAFAPTDIDVEPDGDGRLTVELPPSSVASLTVDVA